MWCPGNEPPYHFQKPLYGHPEIATPSPSLRSIIRLPYYLSSGLLNGPGSRRNVKYIGAQGVPKGRKPEVYLDKRSVLL